jgi:hypothetical protein
MDASSAHIPPLYVVSSVFGWGWKSEEFVAPTITASPVTGFNFTCNPPLASLPPNRLEKIMLEPSGLSLKMNPVGQL